MGFEQMFVLNLPSRPDRMRTFRRSWHEFMPNITVVRASHGMETDAYTMNDLQGEEVTARCRWLLPLSSEAAQAHQGFGVGKRADSGRRRPPHSGGSLRTEHQICELVRVGHAVFRVQQPGQDSFVCVHGAKRALVQDSRHGERHGGIRRESPLRDTDHPPSGEGSPRERHRASGGSRAVDTATGLERLHHLSGTDRRTEG